jgi:hypothetical protein
MIRSLRIPDDVTDVIRLSLVFMIAVLFAIIVAIYNIFVYIIIICYNDLMSVSVYIYTSFSRWRRFHN